jgi:uncharacterized lipoprotein YmbA
MNPQLELYMRRAALTLLAFAVCGLSSCSVLKPTKANARRFVLTPIPASDASTPNGMGIGIAQVKVPGYLVNTSFAVRRGTNEIDYLPLVVWAERLDNGLQRVLAANIATLLPTDKVRLSGWRSDEISAEVYVSLQQFDVDAKGHATLTAWWRILSPSGDKTLKSGETRLTREGPGPDGDPSGAVGALSELAGEFSRQLTAAIKESAARAR